MLDDFQEFDETSDFLDELDNLGLDEIEPDKDVFVSKSAARGRRLFGMTPPQRLILSMEFFFLACILSTMCLLVFNKISPPF